MVVQSVIHLVSLLVFPFHYLERGFLGSSRRTFMFARVPWKLLAVLLPMILALNKSKCNYFNDSSGIKSDPNSAFAYFFCSPAGKQVRTTCPVVDGKRWTFNKDAASCQPPTNFGGSFHIHRDSRHLQKSIVAPQSQRVGETCYFHTDCTAGAFCAKHGACTCLENFVEIDAYCWKKIDPGEAGCAHDRQCGVVWPGAWCSTSGICKCPNGYQAFSTSDGMVCVQPGTCPTNNIYPKLREADRLVDAFCTIVSGTLIQGCDATNTLYDCIHNYCCPTRAFTCSMPLDAGQSSSIDVGSTRWYYNQLSDSCHSFRYLGRRGNSNNFESQQHCESYCKGAYCSRGRPQYDHLNTPQQAVRRCVVDNDCATDYRCVSRSQGSFCCPRIEFICSTRGGLPQSQPSPTMLPFNVGSALVGVAATERFFWDSRTKSCLPFEYLGQAGNFNNFQSRYDCLSFCGQAVCTRGFPLQDYGHHSNISMVCSFANPCPVQYNCVEGVCCPSPKFICNQPMAVGSCSGFVDRFWYNSMSRNCEMFSFSGCDGNENNFLTNSECSSFCLGMSREPTCFQGVPLKAPDGNIVLCNEDVDSSSVLQCPQSHECHFDGFLRTCCPKRETVCTIGFDEGTYCGRTSIRWYFDKQKESCATFQYKGCDGNANNFLVQRDCYEFCEQQVCIDGGEPLVEGNGNTMWCNGSRPCPEGHLCAQTSGHAGYCCPTRGTISTLDFNHSLNFVDPKSGAHTNTVEENWNLAKAGNRRRWGSCPPGHIPVMDTTTRTVRTCDQNKANSCLAAEAQCLFNAHKKQFFCCFEDPRSKGRCPKDMKPHIDPRTAQPLTCSTRFPESCPQHQNCVANPLRNDSVGFCCKKHDNNHNNNDNKNNKLRPPSYDERSSGCNVASGCFGTVESGLHNITGYKKQYGLVTASVCAIGSPYLVGYNLPVACVSQPVNSCPSPYICRPTIQGIAFCCNPVSVPAAATSQAISICVTGQPFLWVGKPISCTSVSQFGNACPSGFSCQYSTVQAGYVCCSLAQQKALVTVTEAPKRSCPTSAASAQPCRPWMSTACGQGSYCQPTLNLWVCTSGQCRSPPVITTTQATTTTSTESQRTYDYEKICGVGSLPAILRGQLRTCSSTGTECPEGYNCQAAIGEALRICCSAVCENVGPVELVSEQPKHCDAMTDNSCGSGFVCERTTIGHICCPARFSEQVCVFGRRPSLHLNVPQTCFPDDDSCPPGFSCQPPVTGTSWICCSTERIPNPCPDGRNFAPFPQTSPSGIPRTCQSTGFTDECPPDHECLEPTFGTQPICCAFSDTSVCQNGGNYLYFKGAPLVCIPILNNPCPSGYSCDLSGNRRQYVCCSIRGPPATPAPEVTLCPTGTEPLIVEGRPRTCNSQAPVSECPTGSICQSRSASGHGTCCSSGTAVLCPNGDAPATFGVNKIRNCLPSVPGLCPTGYRCEAALNSLRQFVCCPQAVSLCLQGSRVLLTGTLPQNCDASIREPCGTSRAGVFCYAAGNSVANNVCCESLDGQPFTRVCRDGAQVSIIGGSPQFCVPARPSGCSADHSCQSSTIDRYRFYCCSDGVNQEACPDQTLPVLLNDRLVPCSPGDVRSCPEDTKCTQSPIPTLGHICCSNRQGEPATPAPPAALCPRGEMPSKFMGDPQTCGQQDQGNCPPTYQCYNPGNSLRGICCPEELVPRKAPHYECPNEAEAAMRGNEVERCVPDSTVVGERCPQNYLCMAVSDSNEFICCQERAVAGYCVDRTQPQLIRGRVQTCNLEPDEPDPCSQGFYCHTPGREGSAVCCTTICSNNGKPRLSQNGMAQECQRSLSKPPNCPRDHDCVPSLISDRSICCTFETRYKSSET